MRKTKIFSIFGMTILLSACGGKKTEIPATTTVEEASLAETVEPVYEEPKAIEPAGETPDYQNSVENRAKVDEFLAEYEKLIDEYDKYITKMKSGNIDMNQAMKMVEKAQSVQEKLQGMENDMTPSQVQKFSRLVSKLSSVASKAASVNPSEIKSINGVDISSLGL